MNNIVFDVETSSLPEAEILPLLPPFDPADVKCGNLGEEKAKAKIAAAELNHRQNFLERAALDATTGRVLCIGVLIEGQFSFFANDDEKALLEAWWTSMRLDDGQIQYVGFFITGFDLPFLIRRSWKLGVKVPRGLRQGRYWDRSIVDLMDVWNLGDYKGRISLDTLSKFLGVGEKNGKGAEFAGLWATDRQKAMKYLMNDLELTARVGKVMGV